MKIGPKQVTSILDNALTQRARPTAPMQVQSLARVVDQVGGPGTAEATLQGVVGTFARMRALTAKLETLTAGRFTPGELPAALEASRSYRRPVAINHAPRPRADEGGEFLPSPTVSASDYPHLVEYSRRITAPDGPRGGPVSAGEYYSQHRAEIQREQREMERAQQAKIKQERGY